MMHQAVFISDLHLHPKEPQIMGRFDAFIQWAKTHTQSLYILGDFLHVWPGDDASDAWSNSIASQLSSLAHHGVAVYFMPGNRDFLIGNQFAARSGITILPDPCLITLNEERVLLTHGDRYCTADKAHQRLRRLTRNYIFKTLFLLIPYASRARLVNSVREHSQSNRQKPADQMDIVSSALLAHMRQKKAYVVIHGHTHKPGLTTYHVKGRVYRQYVLSDWDDIPTIMCYDSAHRFKLKLLTKETLCR